MSSKVALAGPVATLRGPRARPRAIAVAHKGEQAKALVLDPGVDTIPARQSHGQAPSLVVRVNGDGERLTIRDA